MNVSMEEKKIEAIKRMKALKISPDVIKQFEHDDKVSLSLPPVGAHFWLDEECQKIVAAFEKENYALVFTGIRSYMEFGVMDSYLFVSDYPEEWNMDWENIEDNMALTYVYNHDAPDCSEMGSIGIAPTPAAGLRRTW